MFDDEMTEEEAQKIEDEFYEKIDTDPDFDLVDDGTLDTVISCEHSHWLRFSDRIAVIDFLDNDRVCWLCNEED
jgi:hypothetical protein